MWVNSKRNLPSAQPEVYEYHLEHVSETLSPEEKEKEERIHSEVHVHVYNDKVFRELRGLNRGPLT